MHGEGVKTQERKQLLSFVVTKRRLLRVPEYPSLLNHGGLAICGIWYYASLEEMSKVRRGLVRALYR